MNFDDARKQVDGGSDALEVAALLTAEMTAAERLDVLDGDGPFWAGLTYMTSGGYHRAPFAAAAVDRLGVTGFAFSDGPRGVVVDHATCFPVSMARGATWDPELEERVGDAIGTELRAVGATLYGGVCVNLLRHPAWGRAQETYGEDPHHVGEMGAALVRGVQRHAMACVKHFAANSMENARFRVDVTVDEVALHEVYLAQFRRIVDEGVASVMSAYNQVNGEWCGESTALLAAVLRGEWGFDGFVISDWIFGLRDAVASVRAGLDIEMPYRMIRAKALPAAVEQGDLAMADVDACVTRVLATLLRFAAVLDRPEPGPTVLDRTVLASPAHRALAREVAARSVVLLRNEPVDDAPVLPLDAGALGTIAVLGRLAAEVNLGDGGSSDVWTPDAVTIADGLRAVLGDERVVTPDAGAGTSADDPQLAAAVASGADVALVVVGYTFRDEGEFIGEMDMSAMADLFPGPDDPDEAAAFTAWADSTASIEAPPHVAGRSAVGFATGGDRTSLRLHPDHVALIEAVAAANPRTVVAIVGGSAVIGSEWLSSVPALAQSWYGGMEAGPGLADVLLGRVDASGRLPFTMPADEAQLPPFDRDADAVTYDRWHGWWRLERDGEAPAFPFGFGLSYTQFELSDSLVSMAPAGWLAEATLTNTGDRPGADVVQVYARRRGSDGRRRLVGFARAELAPGQSTRVRIEVPSSALTERDVETHSMVLRPGPYEVQVARHAADDATVHLIEEPAPPSPSAVR